MKPGRSILTAHTATGVAPASKALKVTKAKGLQARLSPSYR
ncbi:MAG TPA: hypothetical protein VD997_04100 [Phycisphaerales bacterium]|nr:hypothetical protein [Phycisphaerales bacterium]